MKIKNLVWLVLVIGFTGSQAAAQRVPLKSKQRHVAPARRISAPLQGLTAAESAAVVDTSLQSTCSQETPKISRALAHSAQTFSSDRVQATLTGVWHGRVSGNYEKQFLAEDGFVNVDYYMIVDAKNGEALVLQQFGDARSAPQPKLGAPVWTYVSCGRENYTPRHPAQVHEFHKVSDNIEDGREILKASTGLSFEGTGPLSLSEVWQKLVDTKYFDDPKRSLAYAGGFFNPFTVANVPVQGGSLLSLDMQAEYRGSGMTAATFEPGVPIHGTERGKFLGVTTTSATSTASAGDYLVSSFELGSLVESGDLVETDKAEVAALNSAPQFSMTYDKVVIGPLAPSASAGVAASLRGSKPRSGKPKQ